MTTLAMGLISIGFVCVTGALMFGTVSGRRWSAFFRGSFQSARDYTPMGWRTYKWGLLSIVTGILLGIAGEFLARSP